MGLSNLLSQDLGILQIFYALGIAYLGGVFASLTPCVYPMIPITLSVVGGVRKEGSIAKSKAAYKKLAIRGLVYVAGMATVYSFLGVAAGLTGRVLGTLTNTPSWYLILATILTVCALVMLDILPFDPVAWFHTIKRKLGYSSAPSQYEKELSLLSVFGLGASSGTIAAPCTTPILTAILSFIAQTQSIGLGLALMVMFSLGLGTLLIVLIVFAGSLQSLPRSGNWLKWVKLSGGLILLGFAQYLFYRAGAMGGI